MKELKFAIAGLAVLGIIGSFLPLISEAGLSVSFWDLRKLDAGQFWITMLGLIVPLAMGILAVASGRLARWHAIVATIGFALAAIKLRDGFETAIGGKLMLIAAVLGVAACLFGSVKPERRARA